MPQEFSEISRKWMEGCPRLPQMPQMPQEFSEIFRKRMEVLATSVQRALRVFCFENGLMNLARKSVVWKCYVSSFDDINVIANGVRERDQPCCSLCWSTTVRSLWLAKEINNRDQRHTKFCLRFNTPYFYCSLTHQRNGSTNVFVIEFDLGIKTLQISRQHIYSLTHPCNAALFKNVFSDGIWFGNQTIASFKTIYFLCFR